MSILLPVHLLTIFISFAGFIIRGLWMLLDSDKLNQRWVKIVPHINDTFLLLSGIGLVLVTKIYPWQHPWLATKLMALIVYILLGTIAIKRGKTKNQKIIAWILAMLVFVYMLLVAKYHNPWPIGF